LQLTHNLFYFVLYLKQNYNLNNIPINQYPILNTTQKIKATFSLFTTKYFHDESTQFISKNNHQKGTKKNK